MPESFVKPLEFKSRMISFRLTAEEYDKFCQLCFEHGLPSISELARIAITRMLQQSAHASYEALESRVAELEDRLHHLSMEIDRLNQTVVPLGAPLAAHQQAGG